jgi:hypothetical protein
VGWLLNFAAVVLAMIGIGTAVGYLVVRKTVRTVRRMPMIRKVPIIGVRPTLPEVDPNADLQAYPERLNVLEDRLESRHRAVQDQLRLLQDRRLEVAGKPDREDLVARYDEDIGHLDRRATSMRRVMALVWRTRAVLALRVYLAITARKRPKLLLPNALPVGASRDALAKTRSSYQECAAQVRFYLDEVELRRWELASVVPEAPSSADVAPDMSAAIEAELERTRTAHAELRARMDRLADNLTWLADHAGTLQVVDETVDAPGAAPHAANAAHLLAEVNTAIAGLNALAGSVDHQLAEKALDDLTNDVGRLEQQGLEERAAADAELEVARIVEGFST